MNYHRASLFFAGLTCAFAFAGCKGTTTSDKVATKDVAAFIDVTDDGYGLLTVTANLQVRTAKDDNYVQLAKGDTLQARYGDKYVGMTSRGGGDYQATFDPGNAADVGVAFHRAKFDDAVKSSGLLPDSVEIGDFGGAISRDFDSIVLELPATYGTKLVELDGWCIDSESYDFGEEAATLYIDPGDLYAADPEDECTVNLTITTTAEGVPDPGLHRDSRFHLHRVRSTSFYSVP